MSTDGFQITIPGQLNNYSVTMDPCYRIFRDFIIVQMSVEFLSRAKVKGRAANRTVLCSTKVGPCVSPCVLGTIWTSVAIAIAIVRLMYFCGAWLFANAFNTQT
jgi:hypothetical protein